MKDRIRKLFSNVWTIPNILTMIRLLLIPVFVVVFFRTPHDRNKIAALVIFAVASITDMFDGMLARKLNQITDFGKLFDPLADKLMVLTALFCQGLAGVFPWPAILIVLEKELYMVCGSFFMLSRGVVVSANYFGKAATVCFMVSLILSFFHEELGASGVQADIILIWISVGLAILAMTVYTVNAVKQLRSREKQE